MTHARVLVAGTALALAVGLTACGGGTSSAPSGASKADFCRTFDALGSDATPEHAADELSRVGTPGDIDAGARRGFQVLIDQLRGLPPRAQPRKVSEMVKHLQSQDAADVRAFITYYGSECQGLPGDSSS
jgi:hypothetical protein